MMNRANALILIIAGAAAPGAVTTFHLPDMARLAAYVFVLALCCIVALRGTHEATAAVYELSATTSYDELSVVTTRLGELPSWVAEEYTDNVPRQTETD